jgi:hypothetical protein
LPLKRDAKVEGTKSLADGDEIFGPPLHVSKDERKTQLNVGSGCLISSWSCSSLVF